MDRLAGLYSYSGSFLLFRISISSLAAFGSSRFRAQPRRRRIISESISNLFRRATSIHHYSTIGHSSSAASREPVSLAQCDDGGFDPLHGTDCPVEGSQGNIWAGSIPGRDQEHGLTLGSSWLCHMVREHSGTTCLVSSKSEKFD